MMRIKLSIIIPIYNVEKYLKKCLLSISESINGLEEITEIIMINDGSKDKSEEICKDYEKRYNNFKYIKTVNRGCSKTRNTGISLAQGQYIWFIDADDYIEKQAIFKILNALDGKYEILIFGYNIINENKKVEVLPKCINVKKDIYKQYNIFNSPCNKIYKREILEKNKIIFPVNSHMGEDMSFNWKYFFFIEKIGIIQESLYNYLKTEGVTADINKRIEIFISFDDIIEFYKKNNSLEKMQKIIRKYYILHAIKIPYYFIYNYYKDDKKNQKKEIKRLEEEIKKRKGMFKTEFYLIRLMCKLKIKFYFLKPLYMKLKRRSNE